MISLSSVTPNRFPSLLNRPLALESQRADLGSRAGRQIQLHQVSGRGGEEEGALMEHQVTGGDETGRADHGGLAGSLIDGKEITARSRSVERSVGAKGKGIGALANVRDKEGLCRIGIDDVQLGEPDPPTPNRSPLGAKAMSDKVTPVLPMIFTLPFVTSTVASRPNSSTTYGTPCPRDGPKGGAKGHVKALVAIGCDERAAPLLGLIERISSDAIPTGCRCYRWPERSAEAD